MSHPSIRDVLSKYSNFKEENIKRIHSNKLPPGIESLCCEIYNFDYYRGMKRETITFESVHPLRWQMHFFGMPPCDWLRFECKPGDWVFLPHASYKMSVPSGNVDYPIIINVGDAMFIGNKNPSRPEVKKIRVFN